MDEEKKSLDIKQAAAMEKLADVLEKLPTNMARNTSRERTHEQNAGQINANHLAANAIGAVDSQQGLLRMLGSIPVAGGAAAATAGQFVQGNAWQGQHVMPYKKASEFAEAAGMAGVDLSPEQLKQVRDHYRELGTKVTAHKNVVDRQNSVAGETLEAYKQRQEQKVTEILNNPGEYWGGMGTILFGSSEPYHQTSPEVQRRLDQIYAQDRERQRIEYEGK